MKTIKNIFIIVTILLCCSTAKAYDLTVDGIYYNIISHTELTVEVTSGTYKYAGEVIIPETITYKSKKLKVTSIKNSAFYDCRGLTSIVIPNSVTSIGDHAFYDCRGLTSIVIPNSVASIGNYAFSGCYGLTSVVIGNSVTSIGKEAFWSCSRLKTVVNLSDWTFAKGSSGDGYVARYADKVYNAPKGRIEGDFVLGKPNDVKTLVGYLGSATTANLPTDYDGENYVIGKYAFADCSGLTSIVIPNSVTSIGDDAFYKCSGLTSVVIGNSVTSIGDNAFRDCTGLTSVEIPNSVTSIGSYAFEGCTGLTSVVIPNSVTSIGLNAFNGCSGLTSVVIGNSVTSIGLNAFDGCSGLTSVVIGNSVTSIGNYAFYSCESLASIYVLSIQPPTISTNSFSNKNYINATLYVPQGSLATYQTSNGWSFFWDIQEFNTTEINNINIDNITIKTTCNSILLEGYQYKTISIYSVNGELIERIENYMGESIYLESGTYIINIDNKAIKVKL